MRFIGGKWTGSIIYHLKDEPVRFNDLCRMLGGASKKMIDQRLKELESRGMVVRKVVETKTNCRYLPTNSVWPKRIIYSGGPQKMV